MTRRSQLLAFSALIGLLFTGIIVAQNNVAPTPLPEATMYPEITLEPEATVEFDMSNATRIEGGGISFMLPATLATGAQTRQEAADVVDLSSPPIGQAPAHTAFSFENYAPTLSADAPNFPAAPELLVFNTADFAAYTFGADTQSFPGELSHLQRLLAQRPELNTEQSLPRLPLWPGQTFLSRERYIDFEGGAGILYISYYTLAVMPVLEGDIVAVFQGVSDDGLTYVSAVFPLDTNYLPNEISTDLDFAAYEIGYEALLNSLDAAMNEQFSGAFVPSLDALVAMLESIAIVR